MTNPPKSSPLFADSGELKKTKRTSGQKIISFVMFIVIVVLVFVLMAQNSSKTIRDREQESKRTAMMSDASRLKDDLIAEADAKNKTKPKDKVIEPEKPEATPAHQIIIIQAGSKQKKSVKITEAQKEEGKKYRDFKQNSLLSKSDVESFNAIQNPNSQQQPNNPLEMLMKLLSGGGQADIASALASMPPADLQALTAAIGEGGGVGKSAQQSKLDFLTQGGSARTPQDYSKNTRTAPIASMELKAGTVIPGLLLVGINSDLPGNVIGQVSENVYDTATGQWLLIPQGARILGVYDSQISQGQKRVGIVWNRIVFPDGSSLNIAGTPGTDMAGYSGIKGRVDNHYGQLFAAGLFTSLFTAAVDVASDNKDDDNNGNNNKKSAKDVLVETTGTTIAGIGAKLAERALEIQPTIIVKPGTRFNVIVQQDVVFKEVWKAAKTRVEGF